MTNHRRTAADDAQQVSGKVPEPDRTLTWLRDEEAMSPRTCQIRARTSAPGRSLAGTEGPVTGGRAGEPEVVATPNNDLVMNGSPCRHRARYVPDGFGRTRGFTVTGGAPKVPADLRRDWSSLPAALIPKLIVSIRFLYFASAQKASLDTVSPARLCLLAALSRQPSHYGGLCISEVDVSQRREPRHPSSFARWWSSQSSEAKAAYLVGLAGIVAVSIRTPDIGRRIMQGRGGF
jgi:hypothetical protein